ncbi:hypothetical protein E3N88_16069 [Mikania micrantha]|uniref:Uncharacterized protein n=1 Tax=Mikania micrantha TaxID=192012 RepID=A0A5N6NXE5_9ASTR|nr:hypothetical protein E3N88_16069 [Mikania micrantha]
MGRPPCSSESNDLKKGPWTPEEDEILIAYIEKHGHDSWRALPKRAGLNRCGKSCRLRWINYLNPEIKRGKITQEEENLIINLHSNLGNKVPTIMNPWTNINDQLLHNILQIINMNPLPNASRSTFLDLHCDFKKPDELLRDEMINQYVMNPPEDWMKYANNIAFQPHSECNSIDASLMEIYGDGIELSEKFVDFGNMSDNLVNENQLPSLLSMSPEEQMHKELILNIKNSPQSNEFQVGLDDYYDSFSYI